MATMDSLFRAAAREGERAGARYRLLVPREAMRGGVGTRLGVLAGSSVDFKDYRAYEPGDDLRHLDWGIYARSDREVVKLFREEVAPHVDLLLDASRSMVAVAEAKATVAAGLCGLFASAARAGHCTHALWTTGAATTVLPSGTRAPSEWQGVDFAACVSPGESLRLAPAAFRRNGVRIVVGDLLWPEAPEPFLRHCADGAAWLVVVQVLAQTDVNPALSGNLRLLDAETGEVLELFADAVTLRRYRETLDAHRERWALACRQVGAAFVTLVAEEVLADDWRLPALEEAGLLGAS